jgi:hypothetical protein
MLKPPHNPYRTAAKAKNINNLVVQVCITTSAVFPLPCIHQSTLPTPGLIAALALLRATKLIHATAYKLFFIEKLLLK